jgi:ribosomal protein L37AE/L43A
MARPASARRRRRAAAHACPGCTRPWAVRGVRTAQGLWLFSCRHCSWSALRGTVTHPGSAASASQGPTAAPHAVQLYRQDAELVRSLADYLSEGWAAGGSGVVIATPEHRAALHEELAARRLKTARGNGRLVELNAADTLRLFMRDYGPDPVLFHETVGSLVREHAAAAPLYAFGEMVDLLWTDGSAVAALELEQLWSGLQDQVPFSLLCAYAAGHLDDAGRRVVGSAHHYMVG